MTNVKKFYPKKTVNISEEVHIELVEWARQNGIIISKFIGDAIKEKLQKVKQQVA